MKIINLQQGSPEWEEFRKNKIGASDCPAIMGKNPFKSAFRLWEEKCGKKVFVTDAMRRGTELESKARGIYAEQLGAELTPVVGQHDEHEWMIASLDGVSENMTTVIEIKCPNEEVFKKIEEGKIPEYYIWQIQHQLAVTEGLHVTLVAFNGTRIVCHSIARDEEMIKKLIAEEQKFYMRMMNLDPPEPEADDLTLRSDAEFLEAEEALAVVQEKLSGYEDLKEEERICKEALIYLANDIPSRGSKYRVCKVIRRGGVQYDKIPELRNIDLEKFRKPPTEFWRVS